jgi:hypothetical protein
MRKMPPWDAVETVKAAQGWTVARLAKELGMHRCAVYRWKYRDDVPMHAVLQMEKLSNGALTREVMRPDFYPVGDR